MFKTSLANTGEIEIAYKTSKIKGAAKTGIVIKPDMVNYVCNNCSISNRLTTSEYQDWTGKHKQYSDLIYYLTQAIINKHGAINGGRGWLQTMVDDYYGKGQTFIDYVKSFIENRKGITESTKEGYKTFLVILLEFNKKNRIDWDGVNAKFITNFENFLKGRKKSSVNYVGQNMSKLKTVLTQAYEEELIKRLPKISVKKEDVYEIALNNSELDKLRKINLNKKKEIYRDMFLILCLTAQRHSDLVSLLTTPICKDTITFYQRKTKKHNSKPVTIVLTPEASTLILKYQDKTHLIPSVKTLNENIKKIAKDAGITDMEVTKSGMVERCSLIGSHTGRRTAITNMYRDGLTTEQIMNQSGHQTYDMVRRYCKLTSQEQAELRKETVWYKQFLK